MKVHHGGVFTRSPGRKYIIGKVNYVDLIDVDELSVHEIDLMVVKLGYDPEERMYYHFCIPEHDLDFGLEALGNDQDILNLLRYTNKWKIIDIYIEHGRTTLRTYETSHSQRKVVIKEILEDNSPEMNRTRVRAIEAGSSSTSAKNSYSLNGLSLINLHWSTPNTMKLLSLKSLHWMRRSMQKYSRRAM